MWSIIADKQLPLRTGKNEPPEQICAGSPCAGVIVLAAYQKTHGGRRERERSSGGRKKKIGSHARLGAALDPTR